MIACRSKSAFVPIVFVSSLLLISQAQTIPRPQEVELAQRQERGKQIYLKGQSNGGEISAVLGNGGDFSAALFPCANCHGPRGAGTSEGGLRPPPINWTALSSARRSAMTGQSRGPYNEKSLTLAISAGIDPSGHKLHPGMPRYKLTHGQAADLLAYLRVLGDSLDRGLTVDTIRVGTALPMTGPIAQVGEDIKRVLVGYFAEVNAQGGIYGRRLELVVADSEADSAKTAEATRKLVESDGVFALVGSFEPGDNRVNDEFLHKNEVPLIGPLTFSPRSISATNRQTFYLLPSFFDQARTLVDFAVSGKSQVKGTARPKLAAVCSSGGFEQDALAGLKAQAKAYAIELSSEHRFVDGQIAAKDIVSALSDERPDCLFFFGGGNDLLSLEREMKRRGLYVRLLTCAAMVGEAAFQLSGAVAAQTYLSYPASPPDEDEFLEFETMLRKAGIPLRSGPLQAVAYGAAKVLVEAIKDAGRQLSRPALVSSLERLQNFRTGVLFPVSFNANRRVGSTTSCIVGIDLARKQFVRLSKTE
jgi:ABC-type branched-subunit amino acid transport system substrate-binding protein